MSEQSETAPAQGGTAEKFQKAFEESSAFGRKTSSTNAQPSTRSSISSDGGGQEAQPHPPPANPTKPTDQPHRKESSSSVGGAPERAEWGNHCEYFLTSLGLAVGLGNLWRFPYVCYENGGGTFLIPYLCSLLFLGLPLFFMEMALGQYAGASCTIIYRRMAPALRGLGYAMLAINVVINMYYTVIMAWGFQYMFEGFRSELPWVRCNPEYGTQDCYSKTENDACNGTAVFWNFNCTPIPEYCEANGYLFQDANYTHCFSMEDGIPLSKVVDRVASTEEYFKRYILGLKRIGVDNTWESYGSPQWKMIGCLALSWFLVACSLIKGVASYGKLSYFITLFPYVVLTTFLIYVAQQDGFSDGVAFYTQPDWDKVLEVKVWIAACVQIFFSLGVSVGTQLLLCSYNKFNNNVHRDAWLVGLGNSITSIFAGFVVFGTLGMLAHNNGVQVQDVVKDGTGLAFQAYPEALAIMSPGPLFSFLFFLMLCLLAMSSVSGSWEPVVAAIFDDIPSLREHKSKIYFGACLVGFLGGISCCFPSGYFMFNMLNDRISNAVTYLALIEIVVLSYFYGVKRFLKNIDEMGVWMPRLLRYFWLLTWAVLTPILVLTVIISSLIDRPLDHTEDYEYPRGIQALGWIVELSPLTFTILVGAWVILQNYSRKLPISLLRPGVLMTPSSKWGPRVDRPRLSQGHQNMTFYEEMMIGEKRTEL